MSLIERVKNLILSPGAEWVKISDEPQTPKDLIAKYMLPILVVPVVALVLGWGLVGTTDGGEVLSFKIKGWDVGFSKALIYLISNLLAVLLSALVVDHTASAFRSGKQFNKTLQLVIYSWTPVWLAGIFSLIPSLSFLGILAFGYSAFILYHGVDKIKMTHPESRTAYTIASVLVMVLSYAITHLIINSTVGAIWANYVTKTDGLMGPF
jgi:hypothetical protein